MKVGRASAAFAGRCGNAPRFWLQGIRCGSDLRFRFAASGLCRRVKGRLLLGWFKVHLTERIHVYIYMYIVSYIHLSSSIFIHAMVIRLVRILEMIVLGVILGLIMIIISKMVIIVIVHTYYQEAKKAEKPRNREAKKGRSR